MLVLTPRRLPSLFLRGCRHQVIDRAKVPGVLAVMAAGGLYDDSGKWHGAAVLTLAALDSTCR